MKFEEALYNFSGNRRMYTVEEISELRGKNKLEEFSRIGNHLFCPECEKPQLKHNSCSDKCDYFSTYRDQTHDSDCSYGCKKASKKVMEIITYEANLDKLSNRLQACLKLLLKGPSSCSNPLIVKFKKSKSKETRVSSTSPTDKYYIPRKRLTNHMSDKDAGELKLYYGNVNLIWEKNNHGDYFLRIYHIDKKFLICSLQITSVAYSHIANEYKKNRNYAVAFITELNSRVKTYDNSGVITEKIFFNGKINDSRKMAFYPLHS